MNLCGGEGRGLILGLAFLLCVSCEEPVVIGIDVDPDNLNFSTHYQLVNLKAHLVQVDSISTESTGRILVGRYNDPFFGLTVTKSYSQVWAAGIPVIDETSVYDSLVLQLKYDYQHGDEVGQINNLLVYQLTENLADSTLYFTTSETDRSSEPIGKGTFQYVVDFVDDVAIVNLDTTIRVGLSDALGEDIFNRAKDPDDTTFNTPRNWISYFKGIALEADTDFQTITGFSTQDSRTNMMLYWHYDDDGEIRNSSFLFSFEIGTHYSNISYDRTGTAIEGIDESYVSGVASDGNIYIQAGSGLVAKIDFTPLLEFSDSLEYMVVNSAILTLGSVEPYSSYVLPPGKIIYYFTDSTNFISTNENGGIRTIQVDDPRVNPNGVGSPLETSFVVDDGDIIESYSDRISSYVQAVINGTIDKHQVLVYPNPFSNSFTIDRLLLDPENINLEIYFTITNEISISE